MTGAISSVGAFSWSMLRGQHILILSVIGAISISLFFVPRGAELGLLNLELGLPHRALAILEKSYEDGDSSVVTIGALAQAKAQLGDVSGAILLLEQLLAERPRETSLLKALAGYYRQVGRLEASLRMMERLEALQSSQSSMQELAHLYGELDRPIEQRRILRQLVTQPRVDAGDFIELAKLEKAMGNALAGIGVLKRLEATRPEAIDTSIVALDMSLRIDAKQVDSAFKRAQTWLARSRSPSRDVVPLASVLSVQGHPNLALKILQPLAGNSRDPNVILATSQAEIDVGDREQALERMEAYGSNNRGRTNLGVGVLRLRLAASMASSARVADAADAIGIPSVPMDMLSVTAMAALRSGQLSLANAVKDRLVKEQTSLAPVYLAETYLALGIKEASARWATAAVEDAKGNPDVALRLARLELNMLRKDRALSALRSGLPFDFRDDKHPILKDHPQVPKNLLSGIARLYADLGMSAEAYAVMAELKDQQPSAEADQAWAFSAAMERRQTDVIKWLKASEAGKVGPSFLRDLIFISMRGRSYNLALNAAVRLVSERGTDSDRLLLAEIQVLSGAPIARAEPSNSVASTNLPSQTLTR